MLFLEWCLLSQIAPSNVYRVPMSTRVELLISALSWLTAIGLIVAIIADALR